MKTRTQFSSSRAFTLIELLIVVAIIAILALIAVPNFLEAQIRSKVSRVWNDMRTLKTGLEAYAVDHNHYIIDYGFEEFRVWSQLTTPVAYLTSIPLDLFWARDVSIDAYSEKTRQPYGYHAPGKSGQWSEIYSACAANGIGYIIMCPGPDQFFAYNTHAGQRGVTPAMIAGGRATAADIMYDPTNGIISYGDLFATNKMLYTP